MRIHSEINVYLSIYKTIVLICECSLKQKELQAERLADALHEADKPLARYKDDSDLDDLLRDRVRVGEVDPMLAFIKKNAAKNKTGMLMSFTWEI